MCGLLAVKIVGSLENAGIDPATSRMLSERSTI